MIDGFAFRNNLSRHNTYGIKGANLGTGQSTLAAYFSNLVFDKNVLAGGPASMYPAGNYFPAEADFMAAFVNIGSEDFSLVPGNAFTREADDGGALGADITRLNATLRGTVPVGTSPGARTGGTPGGSSPGMGIAICRPGVNCPTVDPYSHPR